MPAVKEKIRLCSNLLREPQAFDQLGELAGGIARDLTIWAAWNNSQHARLHLPQFCEMMGYHRAHLLRAITPAHKAELLQRGWQEQHLPALSNTIGYAITRMATQLLLFAEPARTNSKRQRYTNKRILCSVDLFEKRKTGTVIEFEFDKEVLENCRHRYQTIDLEDYLSLKTPGGHPDDQARKMYLRLLWKRQYWDGLAAERGVFPSGDNYQELLTVAGLDNYGSEILAASKLRKLLKRVGAMPSVMMKANLKLNYSTGVYEVTWTRVKAKKKDTDKVATTV